MKVSLKWLRDYIDVDLAPKELAHKLTMAGTEVGEITTTGGNWDNVFVGSVKTVKKHPNADRLTVCTVELPNETYEVICGAPNVAAGQKVGFAKAGAQLIDANTGKLSALKAAKIRGIVSNGMICSERELGISEEHEGILVLPETAPVGSTLQDYMGDSILELDLTPNRPDCLSMLGVAWEVAALTNRTVKEPQISYKEQTLNTDSMISVEIADPELCSRYSAAILTDIKIGPSPEWMQNHLIAAGMRPINNIVDVTNYVMTEYGQPLHAFDYTTLKGKKVIVRKAKPGEKLVTLDGETRLLDSETLTISDTTKAVGLAGIMGGINSEVSKITTTILLESANFNNVNIRRTSAKLKLRSEASIRFDKGISPELTKVALCRAIQLIAELSGGRATSGIIDLYPGQEAKRPIQLTQRRVTQVLGIPITPTSIHRVLTSLGFNCKSLGKDAFEVTPPFWRTDISIEDDLVEEVIRIIGYDEVPMASIRGHIPQSIPDPARTLRETLRDLSVAVGLQEVVNYSLSDLESLTKAGLSHLGLENSLHITNPLRLEQEYLRLSLRPGLLANIAYNQKYQENPIGIFEIGKVYFAQYGDLPNELDILAGTITCISEKPEVGFIRTKGIIETILDRLGVKVQFERGDEPGFHPGRVVKITARGDEIGMLGEIHPQVSESFGITETLVHCFEIHLDVFLKYIPVTKRYNPISRYPGVSRDFALIVDAQTLASRAEEIIKSFPLVTRVTLFDVYSGDQLVEGKKSLAYRVQFQSPSRTLNEEEVSIVEAQLLKKLNQSIGAVLRGTQ